MEMAGKRFAKNIEVKQVVIPLQTIGTDLWYVGKQAWVYEVTNAPMLTMTIWGLSVYHVYSKVSGIKMSVTLLFETPCVKN
jgi:hypothetical protein